MRETAAAIPVSDSGLRVWVITRYNDIQQILNGRKFVKDVVPAGMKLVLENTTRSGKTPQFTPTIRRGMLDRDGQDHRRLRALLAPYLNRDAVASLLPRMAAQTASMVDRIPAGKPMDILGDFARPLIAAFTAEWLGIPDNYATLFAIWENHLVTGGSANEIRAAEVELHKFSLEMMELKRREPADDLYTTLVRTHDDDSTLLDENELLSTLILLAVAGAGTAAALANCLFLLASHQDQLNLLRNNPNLLDSALEECMRLESAFRILSPRYTNDPVELDGVVLPPRSLLVCAVGAANRDPENFPNPDEFDITRRSNRHLSFSYGPHSCLGGGLARMEIKAAVRALLDRFSGIRLAARPEDLVWRPGLYARRLDTLPVLLTRGSVH